MAKKLNSMPDYTARMPKHPHDLSQSLTFTAAPGMELPVYYDMLHLGDELHFNGNMFARLQPLSTAALCKIDLHLDYFFVPLSVLYTPFPSIMYQTDDLVSSLVTLQYMDLSNLVAFPKFNLDTTLKNIKEDTLGVNKPQSVMFRGSNVINYSQYSFDTVGKACSRLLDLFDYSNLQLFSENAVSANPVTTPWFLAAYQACHELWFRNDDREEKLYSYQLDKFGIDSSSFVSKELLRLNYVNQYKDYFNAVKVSPIGSSVSMLNRQSSWSVLENINSYLSNQASTRLSKSDGLAPSSDDQATTVLNVLNTSNLLPNFTSANIRQLFMVDKMLRVTGRANKDYESQFLAHFGIKIPHDVMHNITHIGHDMVTLSPSPVISSADTFASSTGTGSALGEIGGQGQVSMNGRKHSFKAPCHGVFLAIFHAIPRLRYYAGISKLHDLSSPDKFWQPEYDKKGMQPIFGYEVSRDRSTIDSTRIGWQFGFEHFKRKYDKISYAFRADNQASLPTGTQNSYAIWVASRSPYCRVLSGAPINGGIPSPYSYVQNFTDLLVTPHDLDGIMQIQYQNTWIDELTYANQHLLYQTDPFIIDFRLDNTKVNFMSEFSEPELD